MCPIHKFTSSTSCGYCCLFSDGFVRGFSSAPFQWWAGYKRIKSQGGLILADTGTKEEEENRLIGKEVRLLQDLTTTDNAKTAKEAWDEMPPTVRTKLKESGVEVVGGFVGSMTAGQLLMYGLSFLGGQFVTLSPSLRPLLRVSKPAQIVAGAGLGILSLQGSFAQSIQAQENIFKTVPGSKDLFIKVLDKANNVKKEKE